MFVIPRLLPASVHVLYATVEKIAIIRHSHIAMLHHGMPGWAVQLQDYAELQVHIMHVLYAREPHDHAAYDKAAKQNHIRNNMSYLYETCAVMLRYLT